MPNESSGVLEQQILGFALARPGFGPTEIAAEPARGR